MASRLQNFLDENGRVTQWPSKRVVQLEVVEYIASHFPDGSQYNEGQLNEKIKGLHTFGDWAIIRREMCDLGYFTRDKNGVIYTRVEKVL